MESISFVAPYYRRMTEEINPETGLVVAEEAHCAAWRRAFPTANRLSGFTFGPPNVGPARQGRGHWGLARDAAERRARSGVAQEESIAIFFQRNHWRKSIS